MIILNLIWIARQDFKSREVSIISLVSFTLLQITLCILVNPFYEWIINIALCLGFVFLQATFIFCWFYLKSKVQAVKIKMTELIGGADIWMILVLALAFELKQYILFITASTILTLIVFLIMRAIKKDVDPKIPLAGFYGVFYGVMLILIRVIE